MATSDNDNMDYSQRVLHTEKQQLTYLTERTNTEDLRMEKDTLFLNLSIYQIVSNMSTAFVQILDDIVTGNWSGMRGLLAVFFKGDRMIYVGLVLLFIAFSINLIDITS